jgi:hypothetical protein
MARLGEFANGRFVEAQAQMEDLGELPLRRNLGGCKGSPADAGTIEQRTLP